MGCNLFLDFETKNRADIKVVGTYEYCSTCTPLMLAWAVDEEPVSVWFPSDPMPEKLWYALCNPSITKIAWHSAFERLVLKFPLGIDIPIEQWKDPSVLVRSMSMPGHLADICEILRIDEDKAKIKDGKRLIQLFSVPNGAEGEETLFGVSDGWNHPEDYKEDWDKFVQYCIRDVEVERLIWNMLLPFSFPEEQWKDFYMSEYMNMEGIPFSITRAKKALALAKRYKIESKDKLNVLTGLENANSRDQLLPWLKERGYSWGSLLKTYVDSELKNKDSKLSADAREVLTLRQQSSQNSYKKLEAILEQVSPDGRLRCSFQFMGASRTGRWSSAGGINIQNLPRPTKEFKDFAKKNGEDAIFHLIDTEDYEGIKAAFDGSILPFASSCIRMLIESPTEHGMIVCDLSAIEYATLGWLARCKGIVDCVKNKLDPYLAFIPYLYPNRNYTHAWLKEQYDTKNPEIEQLRQIAKSAVLGCGYGLGGGEIIINNFGDLVRSGLWGYALAVCGTDMPKSMAHYATKVYRETYPEIVQLWLDMEQAFKQTLKYGKPITVGYVTWNKKNKEWCLVENNFTGAMITFYRVEIPNVGYVIRMKLPSGRFLHYLNCRIEEEEFQYVDKKSGEKKTAIGEVIYYDGIEHSAVESEDGSISKKAHKWGKTKTYGGKLCLSGNTQVLTSNGVKPLTEVSTYDKLWDGLEWVNHDGLIYNGEKETIEWNNLQATKDHEILVGKKWRELEKVEAPFIGLISQLTGLVSVLRLCYSHCPETKAEAAYDAIVELFLRSLQEHCGETKYIPARPALARKQEKRDIKDMLLFPITKSALHGCIGELELFRGATIPMYHATSTMAEEASLCTRFGEPTHWNGYDMSQLFHIGMNQIWTWIELTMMEIMNQEISASYQELKIQIILDVLFSLLMKAKEFPIPNFVRDLLQNGEKTLFAGISKEEEAQTGVLKDIGKQKVYDILNCGPRNRFTILTHSGFLVVHNCENADQAISRDILVNGCHLANDMGFSIFGLYHDEMGTLVKKDWNAPTLEDLKFCMSQPPAWAPTMILGAEGYSGKFYKKN